MENRKLRTANWIFHRSQVVWGWQLQPLRRQQLWCRWVISFFIQLILFLPYSFFTSLESVFFPGFIWCSKGRRQARQNRRILKYNGRGFCFSFFSRLFNVYLGPSIHLVEHMHGCVINCMSKLTDTVKSS